MDDKLFIGARSSLLVSNGALALYAVLAVLSAVFHVTSLCAVLAFLLFFCRSMGIPKCSPYRAHQDENNQENSQYTVTRCKTVKISTDQL